MEDKRVYVTRDSLSCFIQVWPATVGIRKFHGCVKYGAAWEDSVATRQLHPKRYVFVEHLSRYECRERFGFYPRRGTAWYINDQGKRSPVDIDFSG